MSWLGPASKKKENEKGKITQMNGPQTRCEIEPEDRPRWGEERCTEQSKPWTKGRYKSAIGYSVMRRIYTAHDRVTPFPSHRLELRTIRGSGPAHGSSSA
jgi:hypothetical protein